MHWHVPQHIIQVQHQVLVLQEITDLQEAVRIKDRHLAAYSRQADQDQQQIDDLERQLLMQARLQHPVVKI